MAFKSILFGEYNRPECASSPPDFFSDLNLDQVVDTISDSWQASQLKPFFYTPLRNPDIIQYRQKVMQDLEQVPLLKGIKAFAEAMNTVQRYLNMAEKLDFDAHKKGWFLESALLYGEALSAQVQALASLKLSSQGLKAFREYITTYVQSNDFKTLVKEAYQVKKALSEITYCLIIQGGKFKVKPYEGEIDYSVDVEKTFEKFRQGASKDYMVKLPVRSGLNHIEAKILEFVIKLYPEPFFMLDRFYVRHHSFFDKTIKRFGLEILFYISYLNFIEDFKQKGLPFCYPRVSRSSKEISVRDSFDLALAHVLRNQSASLVLNDFSLKSPERILIITGPNQGGKTTFARMVGQLHYLASLGCPVPGREAQLYLFDKILTHFEREEDIRNLRGKFEDDLIRMREILDRVTPDSLLIVNEIFSSTSLNDALLLSREIILRLIDQDVLCAWVTFIDELSSLNEKTVSMVATVNPEDPTERTFKVIRKPADGLAYALSLARKHRLTYEAIKERIR